MHFRGELTKAEPFNAIVSLVLSAGRRSLDEMHVDGISFYPDPLRQRVWALLKRAVLLVAYLQRPVGCYASACEYMR